MKEFVIGSLKYVSDTNFSSLSVTAQKWIDIREVIIELTTVNNVVITQITNKFSLFNMFANEEFSYKNRYQNFVKKIFPKFQKFSRQIGKGD